MQTTGTLSRWNANKGHGFITPQRGGRDIFVDISAFADAGQPPQLHEKLAFAIETDQSGRQRAVAVRRRPPKQSALRRIPRSRPPANSAAILAATALLAAIVFYGYTGFYKQPAQVAAATATVSTTAFHCDGRSQCQEMTSCAEAEFFLRHCANVQLDGDGDGIPCEQQWCGR